MQRLTHDSHKNNQYDKLLESCYSLLSVSPGLFRIYRNLYRLAFSFLSHLLLSFMYLYGIFKAPPKRAGTRMIQKIRQKGNFFMSVKKYLSRNKNLWICALLLVVVIKIFSLNKNWVEELYTSKFYFFFSKFLRFLFGWIPLRL